VTTKQASSEELNDAGPLISTSLSGSRLIGADAARLEEALKIFGRDHVSRPPRRPGCYVDRNELTAPDPPQNFVNADPKPLSDLRSA
jgi:hypothetical protein